MIFKQAELIIAVVLTVIISLVTSLGIGHYRDLKKAAVRANVVEGIAQTTTGIQMDGDFAKGVTHTFRFDLLNNEQAFMIRQIEGERQNETVAIRADQSIPDSVRDNFKERRLARERSQRAALERLGALEAEVSPER